MFTIIPSNNMNRNDLLRSRNNLGGLYGMFDDFWGNSLSKGQSNIRNIFKVDMTDTDNEYIIEADLPGVQKEDISLNIEDNSLVISVDHNEENAKEEKNYLHKERSSISMKRRIMLKDVKYDEISAKLENGVLIVIVPKDNSVNQLRKIDIA